MDNFLPHARWLLLLYLFLKFGTTSSQHLAKASLSAFKDVLTDTVTTIPARTAFLFAGTPVANVRTRMPVLARIALTIRQFFLECT
jgi:hypothetical protein